MQLLCTALLDSHRMLLRHPLSIHPTQLRTAPSVTLASCLLYLAMEQPLILSAMNFGPCLLASIRSHLCLALIPKSLLLLRIEFHVAKLLRLCLLTNTALIPRDVMVYNLHLEIYKFKKLFSFC